jgi:hypothetical protein
LTIAGAKTGVMAAATAPVRSDRRDGLKFIVRRMRFILPICILFILADLILSVFNSQALN